MRPRVGQGRKSSDSSGSFSPYPTDLEVRPKAIRVFSTRLKFTLLTKTVFAPGQQRSLQRNELRLPKLLPKNNYFLKGGNRIVFEIFVLYTS